MRQPKQQLRIMRLWMTPGMGVKRHVSVAILGTLIMVMGVVSGVLWFSRSDRQSISEPIEQILISNTWKYFGGWISLLIALAGITLAITAIGRLNRSMLSNWLPQRQEAAEILYERLQLSKGPRIVAIGGGSGLSNLLRGLRHYSSNLTAVVTVADDGGSSGRLRSAFNMPAPGDLSDCLAALSDNESDLSRLLEYRFERGNELKGHTFGNLLITTLTEVEEDFGTAIRVLNNILNLTGAVYPVTPEVITMHALKASGVKVSGESQVRDIPGPVSRVTLEPSNPSPTPEVIRDILGSDLVVLGPGSLFTSTIPPLLVPAAKRALNTTNAKLIYVCNIMTEAGETDDFTAFDHVKMLYQHLGRYPDAVITNSTPVDELRLSSYRQEKATLVSIDEDMFKAHNITLYQLPILGQGPHAQHDSLQLAKHLIDLAREAHQELRRTRVTT